MQTFVRVCDGCLCPCYVHADTDAMLHTHAHTHTPGSADRELARRTQSRNQVIYDVGGDDAEAHNQRRLARSNSAIIIKSRPSIMDIPKPAQ